jgi:hypothetical protein
VTESGRRRDRGCFENADVFLLVGDDLLPVAIDPAGDHGDEDLEDYDDSWGCQGERTHLIGYTENPQEFNGVALADFFNHMGILD